MSQNKPPRSLRSAVFLLAGGCLLAFIGMFAFIFYQTMPKMLYTSEIQYLQRQMQVTGALIETARQDTVAMAEDIAAMEGTTAFVKGEYPAFINDTWPDSSLLSTYKFNFVFIKDAMGNDLHTEQLDYINNLPMELPEGLSSRFGEISAQVLAKFEDGPFPADTPVEELGESGLLIYHGQVYLFSVMPVMPSRTASKPVGTVVLGSVMNDDYFRWLTGDYSAHFVWARTSEEALDGSRIKIVGDDKVACEMVLTDIDGQAISLMMYSPRVIYNTGFEELVYAAVAMLAALLLLGWALYLVINRLFLRPLEQLDRTIQHAKPGHRIKGEEYQSTKEYQSLVGSINEMLARIEESNLSIDTFSRLLNGMDAFLYVTDAETDEILFINDKMRVHFGLEDDVLGQICWQRLQQGKTSRCDFCPINKLSQNPEKSVVWEERNSLTGRFYRNTDNLIRWGDGRLAHIQHSTDITEEKEVYWQLTKRLEQQQLMANMSQSFLSGGDAGTLIQNALRMAGQFIGFSRVLLGRYNPKAGTMDLDISWTDPERNLPPIKAHSMPFVPGDYIYDALITEKNPYVSFDDEASGKPHYSAMGSAGITAFMAAPIMAENRFYGMISFEMHHAAHTITESELQLLKLVASAISGVVTREALQKNIRRMTSIVISSPRFISYVDGRGYFQYINPAVTKLLGYTELELREGGLGLLLNEEQLAQVLDENLFRLGTASSIQMEATIYCKDGTPRQMELTIFRVVAGEVGIGIIGDDVTEQRQMEKELVAAKEQAEQSSKAKSSFLSRMSHEMRTPMNAIIGMTGIARTAKDTQRKDYCLDKIDEASIHLLGVINDILDMSKIEAGKFELSESEFVFEKMLLRVTNVLNFRVEEKRQNFIVKLDENIPYSLVADEQRLAQVLTNLLSNAIKFTPADGTISLHVKCVGDDGAGVRLSFLVKDTGIGISKEQQSRLFTSFEQADGGIARKFGGTGLGLAISKNILELMGGRVWVDSKLGEGACFGFEVVAKRGEETPSPETAPDWATLRVLAVDDSLEVQQYFADVAATLGFSCVVAGSGEEACALLEKGDNNFNVVFADFSMPGMDGIQLTREIKRRFDPEAVVIMISAAQWDELEGDAKGAGVDGFISKPLFTSVIVDAVNRYLGKEQVQPPPKGGNKGCFEGRRVLLAEDVEINREIVHALLEETGLQIDDAENGLDVVERFKANPDAYDMILMDIHMPEMDGYEATQTIRQLPLDRARTVPIVAMTANVFKEDIEKCLEAGMDAHIGKPIDVDEIFDKLKRYMGREEEKG